MLITAINNAYCLNPRACYFIEKYNLDDTLKKPVLRDTLKKSTVTDTLLRLIPTDTLTKFSMNDTLHSSDTTTKPVPTPKKHFLDDKVTYNATDSMIVDMKNKKAYLYNNAVVVYQDMKLTAGYIELDFGKNMVYATSIKDSAGNKVQKPVSEQKKDKFTAEEITYNFKTKKGKINDVITQQGEGYIHGTDIKKDSTNVFFVAGGKYTTCNLEHPHFYIGAKKVKVIPNDKIVTGPAQLVIFDIPTPLVLPFGFFPNQQKRTSGILIPAYGYSPNWGYYLQQGGFYFGKHDNIDLALRGNIYTNGSFLVNAISNYNKRYRYSGNVNVSYSHYLNGIDNFVNAATPRESDYSIKWLYKQDAKSNPGSNFSANVNIVSSGFNHYNAQTVGATAYLSNTFVSNVTYSKIFTGTPFNISLSGTHSQNNLTNALDITLPQLTANMNRVFPLKNITPAGSFMHQAFEKFGISAQINAKNTISTTTDSLLHNTLKQLNNGMQLVIPMSTSVTLLKYFNLTPSLNTTTNVYFKSIEENYNVSQKKLDTVTVYGTRVTPTYNISAKLSTLVYGNYYFKNKRLKQIRHVMTPAVTATYIPDYYLNKYGYYKTVKDTLPTGITYSPFQNGIYGAPPPGKSSNIGFSINNTLEAKVRTQTDSGMTTKKVTLIQQFLISGAYNPIADSLRLQPINLQGRTMLFKILNVNTTATLDPYQIVSSDATGAAAGAYTRINKFELENYRLGRLTNANIALGTTLHSGKNAVIKNATYGYTDFNIPWNLTLSYNFNYSKPGYIGTVSQALTFSGDFSLTKKWKIKGSSGFDLKTNKLTYTSINVHRDLHCWEMSFNWIPIGQFQSYTVIINVKSSVLQDLKVKRSRSWQDYQ